MTTTIDQPPLREVAPADEPMRREDYARGRVEEMGRVILAYSDAVDNLQKSHEQLRSRVAELQEELGEKNRELERRNRLAALGEMAAGLAHEIRNPLGAIRLYASLLKSDVADRPGSVTTVTKISGAISRLETIVSGVLSFSRDIRTSVGDCDIVHLAHEVIETAASRFGEAIRITLKSPEKLNAKVDRTLLGQAMLNLVCNAAEAIEGEGVVAVELESSRRRGKQFRFRVKDSGPGIDPTILDRIFNPFFTTKDTGTGLGLAIVHRIVEAHDGTITAKNDGGAVFEVMM